MLAVYIDDQLFGRAAPIPQAGPQQARIKVNLIGICNTDIELVKGYMGFRGILGHEFVGIVDACDDERWLGKRVVGEINLGCGSCPNCYAGMQRHCPSRSVLGILNKDGAMAEYVTLPTANLHVVPEHIPDDVAVFTEPLAAACEIAEQVHLVPGMKTMVIGDGKLGLLIVQVLQKYGCDVSLLGRHDNKLEIARSSGATACKKAADLPSSFDLVVEATGASAAFSLALGKVRPRGTLVLKSTYAGNLSVNMAPLVIDEIELIGSRCGRFGPALKMLAQNEVATQNMVSECLALSEAMSAFKLAQQPGVLKVLLKNN